MFWAKTSASTSLTHWGSLKKNLMLLWPSSTSWTSSSSRRRFFQELCSPILKFLLTSCQTSLRSSTIWKLLRLIQQKLPILPQQVTGKASEIGASSLSSFWRNLSPTTLNRSSHQVTFFCCLKSSSSFLHCQQPSTSSLQSWAWPQNLESINSWSTAEPQG